MKNNKKLLLAGVAVVPLAISSWTSENTTSKIQNIDDHSKLSSVELIGTTDVMIDVSEKDKRSVVAFIDKTDAPSKVAVSSKTSKPYDPDLSMSFETIVETYK
ncbi:MULTISPECIES: hypothetical protein [unclassified Chryseobacterium]|uniref:hypothetical protein n=1 Tax=unclassified Chryseobacterium TaxID=2593645 RepID=UPI00226A9D90|nr:MULTISPECIES: hypothetical protein [unclassified Chryseobacterium]